MVGSGVLMQTISKRIFNSAKNREYLAMSWSIIAATDS
jgi:hypothetical protein